MILQQYYLGCLSQASYLIGDETTGRAVVVDPQRDVAQYLADAEALGLHIERVIETHFHADFVSGHLELADRTGATIGFGAAAADRAEFDVDLLADGTVLDLGQVELEIRATPGHTPESISIVVCEEPGAEPAAVLTGDTLFIGDVGRPDLLASAGVTADQLARQLYRSLHERLLTLPDATKVYPAHGAGSACGKNLSTETVSTIGEQRATNYALAPMSEDEFVGVVTEGQPAQPPYFAFDADRNRQDHPLLDEEPPKPFSLDEVVRRQAAGTVLLDTREPADFAAGHLAGSINVGLGGRFAEYAGDVIGPGQDVVLVSEPGTELEAKIRLGRIGFDRVLGALRNPHETFLARPGAVVQSSRLTVRDLAERQDGLADLQVVDVRNPGEVAANGQVPGAVAIPLAQLLVRKDELDRGRPTAVYCASGYRSSIAASALAAHGFVDVSDLLGGFDAWGKAGLPKA